jgi:hypothetical protein
VRIVFAMPSGTVLLIAVAVLAVAIASVAVWEARRALRASDEAKLVPKRVRELCEEMEGVLDKLSTAQARERMARRRRELAETPDTERENRDGTEPQPPLVPGAPGYKDELQRRARAQGIGIRS